MTQWWRVMTMVVGTVPFLNAVPLTWSLKGLGFPGTIVSGAPAELSQWLAGGRIDAGLIPIADYLRGIGHRIVDGIAISSDGAVCSVLVVSKTFLAEAETIAFDRGSKTSVLLLRVLLAERYGVRPLLIPMEPDVEVMLWRADAALLIGDAALTLIPKPQWKVTDLGAEWKTMTGLPFVFAVWAIREGVEDEKALAGWLKAAKEEGIQNLWRITEEEAQRRHLDADFVHRYLTKFISYDLTLDHLKAIRLFNDLAVRHGYLPSRRELHFVGQ